MIINNGLWDLTTEISKERFKIVYIKNGDESTRPWYLSENLGVSLFE
jgi:hypothetical protein